MTQVLYALVDRESGTILKTSERTSRIYTSENRAKSIFKTLLTNRAYARRTKENTKLIKYIPREEIIIDL